MLAKREASRTDSHATYNLTKTQFYYFYQKKNKNLKHF